jgi:hypothetical protein
MVLINDNENLIIDCEDFSHAEYEGMLRGLVTTLQMAVTSPHYQNTLASDIDFAFMLLLKMLPNERQCKDFLKNH